MKAIISMEALPPALRKPWCVLIVRYNIRIAAASGRGVLGPAVIHADTELSLFAPVTWVGGYQATAVVCQGAASIFSVQRRSWYLLASQNKPSFPYV